MVYQFNDFIPVIHDTSFIHPQAAVTGNVIIGKNVYIGPGAAIRGDWGQIIIEDGCNVQENCTIHMFPGTTVLLKTAAHIGHGAVIHGATIGKNCLIMATAHVAHDCHIGDNAIIVNGVALAGHVTVGNFAIIGGLAAVHQFINIGDHAMISGGSLVRKDVPPYTKAAKEPLSYVGINSVGLRRRGFTTEKIREIQEIYRILYQKNYNTSQAVSIIEAEMSASPERDEILQFIRNSSRGVMKGYTGVY